MQKHLSSLFTGIMLALFAFCFAIPTFGQADTTPEWRERAEAESALNTARDNYTHAKMDLNDAILYHNDLVQNWNNAISSAPASILSAAGISLSAAVSQAGLVSSHFPADARYQASMRVSRLRFAYNTAKTARDTAQDNFNKADAAWKEAT